MTTMRARNRTAREHIQYHKDGGVWAKGYIIDGVAAGYWEWFRKDGVRMRSGYFENGAQVGQWTTYDKGRGCLQGDIDEAARGHT
jgi:antitoxin component YwqK of YwqJK toxin-antitoxin module